ncbi:MAG: glycine/betaine/sarcosine/D-proline family reductase selenoprotein B [Deltaproteobacteria bacterium]|nr:glycine/betaine/sarcosine/D-proline family reductase selenoprotein B [Deltaproteobacteria bacterium]
MAKLRVMHYLNQFFAGIGGEEKAGTPVAFLEGPVGPGKRLQSLMEGSAEIVVTALCGDNYFAERTDEVLASILEIARIRDVNFLVAGPAFASGRYGVACAQVCHSVSASLALQCVTGMHPDNPGAEIYKQHKNRSLFLLPTTEAVVGMESALYSIALLVSKLAAGSTIGPPAKEGYLPRGIRVDEIATRSGAARAVSMLLDKLSGRPVTTEIPIESLDVVPAAPPVLNLSKTVLALVTTSGIVPLGNPDGFRGYQNSKWAKYSIENLNSMQDSGWEVVHGGYNTEFMKKNPNYGVPLDACRKLERAGVFDGLHFDFYATPGARGLISVMQDIGREIALDMQAHRVGGVLLVAT